MSNCRNERTDEEEVTDTLLEKAVRCSENRIEERSKELIIPFQTIFRKINYLDQDAWAKVLGLNGFGHAHFFRKKVKS